MRNRDYKDDQDVFTFINSGNCKSYNDLREFLSSNILPIRARWAFYLFGKLNSIDEDKIGEMEENSLTSYGGFIKAEIFYWEDYLENEYNQKNSIAKSIEKDGGNPTWEEIHKIYIEDGYDYVSDKVASDRRAYQNNLVEDFIIEENHLRRHDNFDESSYCDVCQSSPCICSDREKTSSIHDF